MKNIMRIAEGIDVMPLVLAIQRQPELWNQHTTRTQQYNSPHTEISDIWVRYNAWENFKGDPVAFNEEHDSVWYPSYAKLPQVREIVFPLMNRVQGTRLGGVLITRIPPGCRVEPHSDAGWHARHYDKFGVQLQASPEQSFNYNEGSFVTKPGDVFWFNNQATHWVINDSNVDRMTMIVCIRTGA